MAELFARVSVLIAAAFALGLAIGWTFWRFQRRSVPLSEWRATEHDLVTMGRLIDQEAAGRDALAAVLVDSRQEVARLTDLVTGSWNERNLLRRRLADVEGALSHRRAELEQRAALVEHLQRRVIELNALAAQALDVEHHPLARPSAVGAGTNGAFPPVGPEGRQDLSLPG